MITEWRFRTLLKYPNRIICDDGNIYNKYGKKLSLKPSRKGGYLRVRMYKKGRETYTWVHRMIAYAFLESPEKLEVHHIDRNRQNNHYLNLQVMTKKENLDLRVYDNAPWV